MNNNINYLICFLIGMILSLFCIFVKEKTKYYKTKTKMQIDTLFKTENKITDTIYTYNLIE